MATEAIPTALSRNRSAGKSYINSILAISLLGGVRGVSAGHLRSSSFRGIFWKVLDLRFTFVIPWQVSPCFLHSFSLLFPGFRLRFSFFQGSSTYGNNKHAYNFKRRIWHVNFVTLWNAITMELDWIHERIKCIYFYKKQPIKYQLISLVFDVQTRHCYNFERKAKWAKSKKTGWQAKRNISAITHCCHRLFFLLSSYLLCKCL